MHLHVTDLCHLTQLERNLEVTPSENLDPLEKAKIFKAVWIIIVY